MDKQEMNNEVAKELEEKLGRHFYQEFIRRPVSDYVEGRLLLRLGEKLDEEMKDICFGDLDEEAKSGYIEMKTSEAAIRGHMTYIEKILKDTCNIDIRKLFDESKVIERFDAELEARHDGKA
nr:MAG TPA: hypothetical protein [Caudoviricetes sp.]